MVGHYPPGIVTPLIVQPGLVRCSPFGVWQSVLACGGSEAMLCCTLDSIMKVLPCETEGCGIAMACTICLFAATPHRPCHISESFMWGDSRVLAQRR